MTQSTPYDNLWIIAAINNILLPITYQTKPLDIENCGEYMTPYHTMPIREKHIQIRHIPKTNKENRRFNRIHQPGYDSQRRDYRRHQRN